MDAQDPRHGSSAGYQAGCHEPCCRDPYNREKRRYRYFLAKGHEFTVSTARARRKMGALNALGWSNTHIARRAGISRRATCDIVSEDVMLASTAAKIDAAYAVMEMKLPPPSGYVERTKRRALAKGHHPPLAWEDIDAGILADLRERWDKDRLDLVLVEQCLHDGDFTRRLTVPEKREIVRRWTRSIGSERALCQLTGWREGRYSSPTTDA